MKALYQTFVAIPIKSVGVPGLVQMIFIAGVAIFKLVIPASRKEKIDTEK